MRNFKQVVEDFGWPRIIIFLFLVALFIGAPFVHVRMDSSLSDVINRFGQNAIFVLAMRRRGSEPRMASSALREQSSEHRIRSSVLPPCEIFGI